jgi:hypothetical protein
MFGIKDLAAKASRQWFPTSTAKPPCRQRPSIQMSSSDPSCYTVVFESSAEYPSAAELRLGLEKGSDEVKIDTLRKIIISTINGNPQVSQFVIGNSAEMVQ